MMNHGKVVMTDLFGQRAQANIPRHSPGVAAAVEKSLVYLKSDAALASIRRDPYWPKWDSPWWHMLLLHEMGLASSIPQATIDTMVETLKSHYLPTFPIREDELPPGVDPRRQIMCHCALGSIYQVLFAAGVEVDRELPWIRPWFMKYQLPDGGLNCDEAAYLKEKPSSSLVSTLPVLEAVLLCTNRPFSEEELRFLDRGAQYLMDHRLFRRRSNGEVIDNDWLEAKFPRYYDYDFLRGYTFLARWAKARARSLPIELVDEVVRLVSAQSTEADTRAGEAAGIVLKRFNKIDLRSYNPSATGEWKMGEASWFALHEAVSVEGAVCPYLTAQWNDVRPR
jgi:hypothetical protein